MPSLPLKTLNHVSIVTKNVSSSLQFYMDVLGFMLISRPSSFDFGGAWLWRGGIALHLIEGTPIERPKELNSRADHISFMAENMQAVEAALKDLDIEYIKETVVEDGIEIEQLFFHDPDRNMIEICNCDCLPVRLLHNNEPQLQCDTCIPPPSTKPIQHTAAPHSSGSAYSSDSEARVSMDLSPRHFTTTTTC